MKKLTIVIPALNEEEAIKSVINEIPINKLKILGYSTEIIVVNNGSTDNTGKIAKLCGAKVVYQPIKGYGNAYKAGFSKSSGDVIATGDADLSYPFSEIPALLKIMEKNGLDFISADRLTTIKPGIMDKRHYVGNKILTSLVFLLFGIHLKDSQSGMWLFKKKILKKLNLNSGGMSFSQELKIEAYKKGYKCQEVPINYRLRKGKVKLNTFRDGFGNLLQLIVKRLVG